MLSFYASPITVIEIFVLVCWCACGLTEQTERLTENYFLQENIEQEQPDCTTSAKHVCTYVR